MISVKIIKKYHETDDIVVLEFADVNNIALPKFFPGAHIDVHIRPGLVRQYSLCNSSWERNRYVIAVLKEPRSRGGSIALHEQLDVGDVISIGVPRNNFPLVSGRRYLLFAGGIGVTPIICMADELNKAGADFEMHYCTRSRIHTAFLERLLLGDYRERVYNYFDDSEFEWKDEFINLLARPDLGTHLYVCGPKGFIDFICAAAVENQWDDSNIHLEYFAAAKVGASPDQEFSVKIASTGQIIEVRSDETLVSALRRNNIKIDTLCEHGVCGSCIIGVLAGVPEHRDTVLTKAEKEKNDQLTPCCSRSITNELILDL